MIREQKTQLATLVRDLEVTLAEVNGQLDERTRDLRAVHIAYDADRKEMESERELYKEMLSEMQQKMQNDSSNYSKFLGMN